MRTEVKHSESKTAWNVCGATLGGKYKIARIPYDLTGNAIVDTREKAIALDHAIFISDCFNKYWNK